VVPFLVEDELKRLGGIFEKAPNWQPFSVVDGRLITGQNPASSTVTAQKLLKMVGEKAAQVPTPRIYMSDRETAIAT
jgi:putative intracellular protease/amidase